MFENLAVPYLPLCKKKTTKKHLGFPTTESHTSFASVRDLDDKCWGRELIRWEREDNLNSQHGGNIIEACNHGLLFPGFCGVRGPGSTLDWRGEGGVKESWEAERQEE